MSLAEGNRRILIIDDEPSTHEALQRILTGEGLGRTVIPGFLVTSALHGQEGIKLVRLAKRRNEPFAVALVGINLRTGLGSVPTVAKLLESDRDLQVVICGHSDHLLTDILRRFGGTGRVMIHKTPYDMVETNLLVTSLTEKWHLTHNANQQLRHQSHQLHSARQVMSIIGCCLDELEAAHEELRSHSLELTHRLQQREIEVVGTRDLTMFALAQLADSRDPETGEHLLRMRAYAQRLAENLAQQGPYTAEIDAKFLSDFFRSTPLHDIGKVGIPDQILLKPGPLTKEEFEIMKRHTVIGAEALEKAASHSNFGGFLLVAAQIARSHHERFDGKGYPDGLLGYQIPLCARITAVADVFDALTSARVYKDAMEAEDARGLIEREAGSHFDPAVVDAFRVCYSQLLDIKDAIDGGQVGSESPVICFDEPLPLFDGLDLLTPV